MRTLVLAPFTQEGLKTLAEAGGAVYESWLETGVLQDPEELGARINRERFDAVVVEGDFLFGETFDAAPALKAAGICRGAVNQIDVAAATERGVVVINAPGRNAHAVAEMTLGLMLGVARRISEADRYMRQGRWGSPAAPYLDLRGYELSGRTAGIVGLGAVGRRVVGLCRAVGMKVIAHDPAVGAPEAQSSGAAWVDLESLLESADVVSLHCPPSLDSSPMIGVEQFGTLRPGAILINTASAALVNSAALAAALRSGRLAGAAIDVFETAPIQPGHPLLDAPNVVLTPHIGGATRETVGRHSQLMVDGLLRVARGERPENLVNPEVWDRRRVWT